MSTHYTQRIVTDGSDRAAWFQARSRGITATDVAKLSTPKSILAAAEAKLFGPRFFGNAYTQHGRDREPYIANWVEKEFQIQPSSALFHASADRRHLATPDGVSERTGGSLELAEIKTSNKPLKSIPKNYMRQIWWQQHVLGAERTLFVWEEHKDFIPVGDPQHRWIDRDQNEIDKLLVLVDSLLDELIRRTS